MLAYIQTNQGINTILRGRTRTISSDEPYYQEILEAIKKGADENEVLEILERDLHRVQAAVEALNRDITEDVTVRGGQVLYKGMVVDNSLTTRMLQQLNEGFNLVPMAKFLANLMQNPSYRAVCDLYSFLEYGKMPITEDGCFLAYKKVREDYRDIYTGLFDNTPGRPDPVEMPRNRVNEDPDQTCSKGLHCCSFEYLSSYGCGPGNRVVIVKVNPRDVVAIPKDYNNTKMRVCRYWVIGEDTEYFKNHQDHLRQMSVATEGKSFRVEIEGHCPDFELYELLSEASRRAEELVAYESTDRVVVRNTTTGVVVLELENEEYVPEDEDGENTEDDVETESFDVHYFTTKLDLDNNTGHEYAADVEDLNEARDVALEAYKEHAPYAVRVIDSSTGEVKTEIK